MNESLNRFFEICLDLLAIGTADGRFIKISSSWTKVLGWSREELMGMKAGELIHPEDLAEARRCVKNILSGEAVGHIENRYRHKKGHWVWLLWTGVYSPEDQLIYAIAKNITNLKQMEEKVKQSERRLNDAQKLSGIGSWELELLNPESLEANPLHWSDQVYRVFGYEPGEIAASFENFFKIIHPEDRLKVKWATERTLHSHQAEKIEYRIILPSGAERVIQDTPWLLRDPETQKVYAIAGTVQDVTEQRRVMKQMVESQKMESIGRLTAGIAHDFNNMLAAIYGNLALMARHIPSEHPAYRQIASIQTTARRATDLTAQLLAFSRQQVLTPTEQNLNSLVTEALEILSGTLEENIRIDLRLSPHMGLIEVDSTQMIQIILNLALNARDAMPEGGLLTIETSEVPGDATRRPYALLKVSDTGHGMDPTTMEKIFEPFFTTKEPGSGTGLGLSTVYGIVNQSGGTISVKSQPGQGTTFEIFLPVSS